MEAGMVNALRFIFILVVIYYAFKLIVRYILPWVARRSIHNFQKQFYEQNPHLDPDYQEKQKQKEGEVHIKTGGRTAARSDDDDLGEYIDYEEIKEKE